MKRRNKTECRRVGRSALAAAALLLCAVGCGETERTEKTTGGETHFLSCSTDSDCSSLSSSYRCVAGVCRDAPVALGSPSGSGGASSTTSDPVPCAGGEVAGPQVIVLGDTFMALTHQITLELEKVARARGALPADQSYRDQSTVFGNTFALGGSGLADQYSRAVADAPVK